MSCELRLPALHLAADEAPDRVAIHLAADEEPDRVAIDRSAKVSYTGGTHWVLVYCVQRGYELRGGLFVCRRHVRCR